MTEREIIDTIAKCAKLYMENLNGKNFMVIARNKENKDDIIIHQILFTENRFRHLTGFNPKDKSEETGKDFINKFITKDKISGDISIKSNISVDFNDYTFSMVEEKLNILQYAMNIKNNARICGEFGENHSFLDSDFGIGNSTITMGFKYENGNPEEDALVPNTVLNSNVEKEVKMKYDVIAVLEKRENAIKYNSIVELYNVEVPTDKLENIVTKNVFNTVKEHNNKVLYGNIDCEYYAEHIDQIKTEEVAMKVLDYLMEKKTEYLKRLKI